MGGLVFGELSNGLYSKIRTGSMTGVRSEKYYLEKCPLLPMRYLIIIFLNTGGGYQK